MGNKYFSVAEHDAAESFEDIRENLGLVLYSAKNANSIEDSKYFVREELPGGIVMFLEVIMQEDDEYYHVPIDTSVIVEESLDIEELFEEGKKCMAEKMPALFQKTTEYLNVNMLFGDANFYILHTEEVFGASALMYEGVKERIAEEIGGSYFILPATRDWMVVTPDDGSKSIEVLQKVLMEQNEKLEDPDWKLSDEVLYYSVETNELTTANDAKHGGKVIYLNATGNGDLN